MNNKTIRRGFFIEADCEDAGFVPVKGMFSGNEYEILGEVETLFGPHFIVKVGRKEMYVPKTCIVVKTNQIFIAESNGRPHLHRENSIKVLRITKSRTTPKPKEIIPVFAERVAKKLWRVVCSLGNTYFLMDIFANERPYGYVGRSFYGPPVVGESFSFKSVLSFPWNYNRTRRWETPVHMHKVFSAVEIGENFFKITGETRNRKGREFFITAYVSL